MAECVVVGLEAVEVEQHQQSGELIAGGLGRPRQVLEQDPTVRQAGEWVERRLALARHQQLGGLTLGDSHPRQNQRQRHTRTRKTGGVYRYDRL